MLNALYELQTEDGAIITVNNRVLLDKRAGRDAIRVLQPRHHRARGAARLAQPPRVRRNPPQHGAETEGAHPGL